MTKFNKLNPFHSKIIERTLLNKPGSSKATYHISLSLEGSDIRYNPGDSIGIWPTNDTPLVDEILSLLGADEHTKVYDGRTLNTIHLSTFLAKHANLKRVTPAFLQEVCGKTFDDPKERIAFTQSHDILDTLQMFRPHSVNFDTLSQYIAPLLPRFYSIASSQAAHPSHVHLLVATFAYEQNGRVLKGVGSDFLCREETQDVPIYLHPTETFTLPEDPSTPLIMIGPGTGVAPYKAFLEERIHSTEKTGKHWLFFGECNKSYDFYYEAFFSSIPDLSLSLAFSRDQEEKVYVQHKMLEEKEALYTWLMDGAVVYVCGDAKRMAKDVVKALHTIYEEVGNLSEEDAKSAIKELRKSKRLRMDVY